MPLTNEKAKRKLEGLVARGERAYEEKLRDLVEPEHIGGFLSLEPDSGRYFLGPTAISAMDAVREAMPDCVFYLMRVGYKAAHTIGGSVVQSKR